MSPYRHSDRVSSAGGHARSGRAEVGQAAIGGPAGGAARTLT